MLKFKIIWKSYYRLLNDKNFWNTLHFRISTQTFHSWANDHRLRQVRSPAQITIHPFIPNSRRRRIIWAVF